MQRRLLENKDLMNLTVDSIYSYVNSSYCENE